MVNIRAIVANNDNSGDNDIGDNDRNKLLNFNKNSNGNNNCKHISAISTLSTYGNNNHTIILNDKNYTNITKSNTTAITLTTKNTQ